MRIQPHLMRIATFPIASLLLILLVAVIHPTPAAELRAESDAERYVLNELQNGYIVDLARLPEVTRKLSGTFLANLLTNKDPRLKISGQEIYILNAVITGQLNLEDQEIPYNVELHSCTFEHGIVLSGSRFAKSLRISNSTFNSINFTNATIGRDFIAEGCHFIEDATFRGLQVGHDFIIFDSTFDTTRTSFEDVRVDEFFVIDGSRFNSTLVLFNGMRVQNNFSAKHCAFTGQAVAFFGARLADIFLDESTFENVKFIDFTRMQADFISFDKVKVRPTSEIKLERMTFKLLSPVSAEQLQFLLSQYNAEFYTDLETSLRTHGYADEADKVFIAKKRAERRENCKDFLRQCNRGAWGFSLVEDLFLGYGKRLQNLLYWSLGFFVLGVLVFRSEKGMRTKDWKDAPYYAGKYRPFWYSLDLFLPIIKLGEADVWTPKDNRRLANLYKKIHIIIGSLFVPIGLAALTGIIK